MQQRRELAGHESGKREAPGRTAKLDTRKPTRNGSYTIPVQMGLGLLGRKEPGEAEPIFTLSRFALVAPAVIILKE